MIKNMDQIKFVIALIVGAFSFGIYLATFEARVGYIEKSIIRNEKLIEKIDQKINKLNSNIFGYSLLKSTK
jgi:hypothetical protein